MSGDTRIRVLVVDDHRVLAEALVAALSAEPDIEVVGIASSVATVADHLGSRVDVVLMDYMLGDGTGADATRVVKARQPAAAVVILTAVSDGETILDTVRAGADGYLTKDRALDDVVAAVRAAHAHEMMLPRSVIMEIAMRVAEARQQADEAPPVEALTPRELEVLRLLAEGLDSATICARLSIAPNTLRTHTQNMMSKLGTHSKLETVAYALRNGLVEPPQPPSRRPRPSA
ncbi:MAG: response regulator transcription factor [Chloroflexi bacterium]|jgi:DNA-binding NarL/FixJ family response regulator|nr:response regulator transcription factor [Chloroflexota bacterium]